MNKRDREQVVGVVGGQEGEKRPDGRPDAKPEQHPASRANLLMGNEGVVAARAAKASYLALRESGVDVEEAAEQLQLSKATRARYEEAHVKATETPIMSRDELAAKVRAAISSLDERGAWLEPLVAGQKTTEPVQRRISSGTFARNVKLLSSYLTAIK